MGKYILKRLLLAIPTFLVRYILGKSQWGGKPLVGNHRWGESGWQRNGTNFHSPQLGQWYIAPPKEESLQLTIFSTFSITWAWPLCSYSPNSRIYDRIVAVVRHPRFYYVFTTIHVLNLPRFAAFCLFCDKFNNHKGIYIPGNSWQNRAEYGISGGFSNMIKILFVCHGRSQGVSCLAAFGGWNAANRGRRGRGWLRFYYYWGKKELLRN